MTSLLQYLSVCCRQGHGFTRVVSVLALTTAALAVTPGDGGAHICSKPSSKHTCRNGTISKEPNLPLLGNSKLQNLPREADYTTDLKPSRLPPDSNSEDTGTCFAFNCNHQTRFTSVLWKIPNPAINLKQRVLCSRSIITTHKSHSPNTYFSKKELSEFIFILELNSFSR